MKCNNCGYQLWNIAGPKCPECGSIFAVSDYDFKPNAVVFSCPHCQQAYYGTDERGHLQPRSFECIGCHNAIDMDDMILRPAKGYDSDTTLAMLEHPWEKRGENRSTFRAWFRTSWLAMSHPTELVAIPSDLRRYSGHWGFVVCNSLITTFLGIGSVLLFFTGLVAMGSGKLEIMLGVLLALGAILIGSLLLTLLSLLIYGAVVHLMLRLFAQPQGTLTETYRCMCYSQGVTAMMAVPFCGFYVLSWVGSIWCMVISVIMLMKVHKTSGLATTVAVLVMPLLMMIFAAVAWVLIMNNLAIN